MGTGSGDAAIALGAESATALYGVTGSGIRIGIISTSYNADGGAAAEVAAGALPPDVTVLSDADSTDEGRAMMELAYQIAPNASYVFAAGGDSVESCAAAVAALQAAGCTIIVDDLSYLTEESDYQTGTVLDQAIETAVAGGVSFFSAAGNEGTSYVQQGFAPIGVSLTSIGTVTAQNFGDGSPYLTVTVAHGETGLFMLQWAQPFATIGTDSPGAANSFAAYLLNAQGTVVAEATADQLGGNPAQLIDFDNTTGSSIFRLIVVQNGGTAPAGQLLTVTAINGTGAIDSSVAGIGDGDLFGHALLANTNVVGAVTYSDTPAFGVSPAAPASYTSTGPGEILFTAQGAALAAPVSANGPSFAAVAGSNTSVPGFATFDGTSAAAPNAGAVAALMMQADPALTPADITALLEQSAIPVATTLDNAGAGLIQARAAVELSAAADGTLWSAAAGGDWTSAADWSVGAAPTGGEAVMLGDDLGGIAGNYTVTVAGSAAVAGALTLSAVPASATTLALDQGGTLTLGGPASGDITAGDLLVATGGTLSVGGGALVVSGTLNANDGTIAVSAGSIDAATYTQNAGTLVVGAGTMALTGGGLQATGGAMTIGADGSVTTTSLALSDTAVLIAGRLDDSGSLSAGSAGGTGSLTIAPTGTLTIGAAASGASIGFAGGGLLDIATASAAVLDGGLSSVISGLGSGTVAFDALAFSTDDADIYANGTLTIDDGLDAVARLALDPTAQYDGFTLRPGSANQLEISAVACFAAGTRLLTAHGPMPVEALRAGDRLLTADGAQEPAIWIGQRRVDCRRHPKPELVLPLRIRAHAFGAGRPARALYLSPDHALFLEGVLIPVRHLIDGAAVRQVAVRQVTYFHVELAEHHILLAEGLAAESYLNTGDRRGFAGSAPQLHPSWGSASPDAALIRDARGYAPLRVAGPEVDRARARLAAATASTENCKSCQVDRARARLAAATASTENCKSCQVDRARARLTAQSGGASNTRLTG